MTLQVYISPYYGQDFFGFFLTFFQRLISLEFGGAADEVQVMVLSTLGMSNAMMGCLLIYRRESMLANSLSHTALLGIVLSYLIVLSFFSLSESTILPLSFPLLFLSAFLTGFLTQLMVLFLHKALKVQSQASNGLVFHFLFSLGLILLTLFFRHSHVGLELLVGNVDTLTSDDLKLSGVVFFISLCAFILLFKYWKVFAFDEKYAKILGLKVKYLHTLFIFLLSLNVIGAIRGVGVLMMLCLITAPALAVRSFSLRLKHMMLLSPLFSLLATLVGVALSRHWLSTYDQAFSTGAIIGLLLFFSTLLILTFHLLWKAFCKINYGKIQKEPIQ